MKIELLENSELKSNYVKEVIDQLKDWFELDEGRNQYIEDSKTLPTFICFDGEKPVGFMTLKETSKYTLELHVIGVLKEYQRNKLGSKLFSYALEYAKENNYEFMQVKTVATGYYKEYDLTNKFYQNIGFKELEVITSIWDEANPCQIYVMSIK